MGLFLAQGGDQIETRTAPADTQASGLLWGFLFTTTAHRGCGQTATGERQQAQSSVERDGGAARIHRTAVWIANQSIIFATCWWLIETGKRPLVIIRV